MPHNANGLQPYDWEISNTQTKNWVEWITSHELKIDYSDIETWKPEKWGSWGKNGGPPVRLKSGRNFWYVDRMKVAKTMLLLTPKQATLKYQGGRYKLMVDSKVVWSSKYEEVAECAVAAFNSGDIKRLLALEPIYVAMAMKNPGLVEVAEYSDALDDIAENTSAYEGLSPKDRESLQKARIGQGIFRQRLIEHWKGCAVTGCKQPDLLVASHIKPWRDCTVTEALDFTNGLLLLPNIDLAFDRGFISFDDEGQIVFSPQLTEDVASQMGISKTMKLRHISPNHQTYLQYHRANVFRKMP